MKSSRKARIFNVPCEGWFRDLTQRLVHGIIAQASARWASIPTSMVVLLFIGKGLAGRSSEPLSITSTICLFKARLGTGWWTSSSSMTQLPLQLIDFTLHVSSFFAWETWLFPRDWLLPVWAVCILPSWLPFRSRLLCWLPCWEPFDSAWCRSTSTWCGPATAWCGPASSIVDVVTKSPLD